MSPPAVERARATLAALGLPGRWSGQPRFTLLASALGDGTGLLAAWAAWRVDPARCQRLHLVAFAPRLPRAERLAPTLAQAAETLGLPAACVRELLSAWPLPLPDTHRLELEDGALAVTLIVGTAARGIRALRFPVDAFGIEAAPSGADVLAPAALAGFVRQLARLAAPGATLALSASAPHPEEVPSQAQPSASQGFGPEQADAWGRALVEAGFVVQGAPAPAGPLVATHAPAWSVRRRWSADEALPAERRAIVIGAGLAGTAAAAALVARGWEVDLVEQAGAIASAASGNPAGAFHPHLSRDDCGLSRLSRAGLAATLRELATLGAFEAGVAARCGLLQVPADAADARVLAESIARLGEPGYARAVDAAQASALAGAPLAQGGVWFTDGGWIRPAALCALRLERAGRSGREGAGRSERERAGRSGREQGGRLRLHLARSAARLDHAASGWTVLDPAGEPIAHAPVVVLAAAQQSGPLLEAVGAAVPPLAPLRGQVTRLPAQAVPPLRCALSGAGYLLPALEGFATAGVDYGGDSPEPTAEAHARNLERAASLFVADSAQARRLGALDPASLKGRSAFRCATRDRLPVIGAAVDAHALAAMDPGRRPPAWAMPRLPGLFLASGYGSRGLLWSALAAQWLVARLEGEPPPLSGELVEAIDPARFVARGER